MSGTKKIAKTQMTVSKWPSGNPRLVMSPVSNRTLPRPLLSALPRAIASSRSARSTPSTCPFGPTRSAAGSAAAATDIEHVHAGHQPGELDRAPPGPLPEAERRGVEMVGGGVVGARRLQLYRVRLHERRTVRPA